MLKSNGLRTVATFYTTADAMATEKACKQNALPGRLIPVPRALTSDCGIAFSTAAENRTRLAQLLEDEKIEFSGITDLVL